ncbi:MAG: hypothetical protein Q8N18_14680 [Opitutaceae bacterium]|nr:hypothetical protein [Opitutaceae bacterium]
MHPDTKQVADHMRDFGLSVLGRAIYDATFSEHTRPFAHALSVVHAAHGAEIVLKARIAQEHPLLIFSKLPSQSSTSGSLSITELFEHGRSWEFDELPNRLWASTGFRIQNLSEFQTFGKLRNQIVHFAVPDVDLSREALKFCIETMEPIVHSFWTESAIRRAEEWDEVIVADGYLEDQLKEAGINVPACVAEFFESRRKDKT